jgi:hypothetical protein
MFLWCRCELFVLCGRDRSVQVLVATRRIWVSRQTHATSSRQHASAREYCAYSNICSVTCVVFEGLGQNSNSTHFVNMVPLPNTDTDTRAAINEETDFEVK